MRSFKKLTLTLSAALALQMAFAADRNWSGATDDDWNEPTNWTEGAVPGANDFAILGSNAITVPPVVYDANTTFPTRIQIDVANTVVLSGSGAGSFLFPDSNTGRSFQSTNASATGFTFNFPSGSIAMGNPKGEIQVDFSNLIVDAAINLTASSIEPGTNGLEIFGSPLSTVTATLNIDALTGDNAYFRSTDANLLVPLNLLANVSGGSIFLTSSTEGLGNLTVTSSNADATVGASFFFNGTSSKTLTIDIGADYTFTGTAASLDLFDTLAITTGKFRYNGTATATFNSNITIASGQKLLGATPTKQVSFTGSISGNGSIESDQNGDNVFEGAVTNSGGLTVSAGSVTFLNAGVDSSVDIVNNSTEEDALRFSVGTGQTREFSGNISGSGVVQFFATGDLTLSGQLSYTGDTSITNGGSVTFDNIGSELSSNISFSSSTDDLIVNVSNGTDLILSGTLTGGGTLTKNGADKLSLTNANISYLGATTINAGTLELTDDNIESFSSTVSFGSNTAVLGFNVTSGGDFTFSQALSGNGGLAKIGVGQLTLDAANSYSGDTTLSAGTLVLEGVACANSTSDIVNDSALTFSVSTTDREYSGVISSTGSVTKLGDANLTLSGLNTYGGATTITAGTLTLEDLGVPNSSAITNNSALIFNLSDGVSLSHSGDISGTGTLEKIGLGAVSLTGSLSYDGDTTVTAGTLSFENTGVNNSSNTTIASGATLDFNATSGDGTFSGSITGAGAVTKNGNDKVSLTNASIDYTGGTTINAGTLELTDANIATFLGTVNFGSNTGVLGLNVSSGGIRFFSRPITDNGNVTKTGAGQVALLASNDYTGTTTVSEGTLIFNDTSLNSASDLVISSGALAAFDLFTSNNVYSGAFSGAGTLAKSNIRTLTLSGTNNLTGTLSISSGSVILSGTAANGSHAILLNGSSNSVIFDTDGADRLFSGVISGTKGLGLQGGNQLELNQANTYTGDTTVLASVLKLTDAAITGVSDINISAGASVLFSTAIDVGGYEYTGNLTGSGGITVSGVDTVTLSGTNTYSGDTSVSMTTTLILEDSGVSANTNMSVDNGGVIRFVIADDALTYSGDIDGSGGIQKQGANTLTLDGTHIYSGSTTISVGRLNLQNTAINSSSDITNNSALTFTVSDMSRSYSGDIDGTGSLTVAGSNTLTLSGTNSYQGGTTITGSLLVNSLDALPTTNGVTNNGTLTFNLGADSSFSGTLSGSGNYTKSGAGTLTLSGTNTLTSANTFTLSNGGILGSISSLGSADYDLDGATNLLTLNQTTDGTLSLTTQGSGLFTKTGDGEVTLTSTLAHTGDTTLSAGTLNIASNGTISTSDLTVAAGATLKGVGSAARVTNNGTLAPGASIGTLTLTGNYTHANTATFELELNQTTSDKLVITGTADIQGGTLSITPASGFYRLGTTYNFIETSAGVSGAFDTITDPDPFFEASVAISGNNMVLTVLRSEVIPPIATRFLRGNAKRAADYLFSNSFIPSSTGLADVFTALLEQPQAYYPEDLVKITPIIYSSLPQINLQNDTRMANAMQGRFLDYCPYIKTKNEKLRDKRAIRREKKRKLGRHKYFSQQPKDSEFYFEPFYFFYNQQPNQGEFINQGQPGFKANTYGSAFGWQNDLKKKNLLVGLSGGFTHSSTLWLKGLGHGKFNSFYLSPLITYLKEEFYFTTSFLFSYNFYHVKRRIKIATFEEKANYRNQSYDLLLHFEAARLYRLASHISFQPDAMLNFLSILSPATSETDAPGLNLHIKKLNTLFLQPTVKFRLIYDGYFKKFCLTPNIYLGWIADIPLTNGVITSRFVEEQTHRRRMKTKGYHYMVNQLVSGVEFAIEQKDSMEILLGFEWTTFSKMQIYQLQFRTNWKF